MRAGCGRWRTTAGLEQTIRSSDGDWRGILALPDCPLRPCPVHPATPNAEGQGPVRLQRLVRRTGWVSCYLALLPAVHANYSYYFAGGSAWALSNLKCVQATSTACQCHTRTRLSTREFFLSLVHSVGAPMQDARGVYLPLRNRNARVVFDSLKKILRPAGGRSANPGK